MGFAFTAWALSSRLTLHACHLGFALTAWALLSRLTDWTLPLQLGLCPRELGYVLFGLCSRGSHYTLTARASPLRLRLCFHGSRLGLCPQCSCYALATRALPSRLGLCPRGLCCMLAAWASPLRLEVWLGLCPRSSRYALTARASSVTNLIAHCNNVGWRRRRSGQDIIHDLRRGGGIYNNQTVQIGQWQFVQQGKYDCVQN